MPRRSTPFEMEMSIVVRHLVAVGDEALSDEDKFELWSSLRGRSEESDRQLDDFVIRQLSRQQASLVEAQETLTKLKRVVEKLSAPPWHPARFLGTTCTEVGDSAIVRHGNTDRVVAIGEDVDLSGLASGDFVLLGPEANVVIRDSFDYAPRDGETAIFDRVTADGRVVLRHRDQEIVVTAAGSFDPAQVKSGDCVRWDRDLRMAFEKMERSMQEHLFLEETPEQSFADIGGLDGAVTKLKRWIWLHRDHGETTRLYGLKPRRGAVLAGPPGNGKTMLARAFANYVAEVSTSGRSRFMNIRPGALNSMWYGQSEANYRETFRVAREIATAEPEIPIVMFFDEVDAVGAARGSAMAQVHDRVMPAFMTELDGLDPRGNIIVLAATNRPEVLDPALQRPDRLGDDFIHVPRPDRRAAASIFGKYLHPRIPVDSDGIAKGAEAHEVLIDSVLAKIFSSNGESAVATLRLRDGVERTVRASDLVSGAVIAKIVGDACERACLRQVETGERGVRLDDLLSAVDDEIDRVTRFLSPLNCRKHLDDLPQDVDVVSVAPVVRKVRRPQRYLRIA